MNEGEHLPKAMLRLQVTLLESGFVYMTRDQCIPLRTKGRCQNVLSSYLRITELLSWPSGTEVLERRT